MSDSTAASIPELLESGIRRHQAGETTAAERIYRQILEQEPRHPDALNLLGMIAHQAGNFDAAIELIEKAIVARPKAHQYHGNLGIALKATGRLKDAEASLRRAIEFKPDDAIAHYHLGNTLALSGRVSDSVASFQQSVRYMPEHILARASLAMACRDLGRFEEAENHYREVIERNPEHVEAMLGLATVRQQLGWMEDAAEWYQKALRLDPTHPDVADVRTNLANAYRELGKLDESLKQYDMALASRPQLPQALAGKALLAEKKGDYEEAHAILKPLVDAGTTNPSLICAYGLVAPRYGKTATAVDAGERVLKEQSLQARQKLRVHYMLGDLYDQENAYDRAFAHYSTANKLLDLLYDEWEQQAHFDALIKTYSQNAIRQMPRADNSSELPVFIIGMPRSGTSLAEQILASHPSVVGAGELNDIGLIIRSLGEKISKATGYPQYINDVTKDILDEAARGYLSKLQIIGGNAVRVTDKAITNTLHLGLIAQLFPKARVIHCIRNPLDTCLSCYFQNFGTRHAYSSDLTRLGLYYRDYLRLMEHWREVLNIQMIDIGYEEVIEDLEGQSRKMVAFCGLEWDDACLQFHENVRFVGTASYNQVRQPLYRGSMDRWKHYETYIDPLREALGDVLNNKSA